MSMRGIMSITVLPAISSVSYEFFYNGDGPVAQWLGKSYRIERVTINVSNTRTPEGEYDEDECVSVIPYGRALKADGTPNRNVTLLKYVGDDEVRERILDAFNARHDWQGQLRAWPTRVFS